MEIRKLDGVGDGFYLRIQATNVVIGYVGNLLKDEIFNFLALETLNKESCANIEQKCVTRSKLYVSQGSCNLAHPLFFSPAENDCSDTTIE